MVIKIFLKYSGSGCGPGFRGRYNGRIMLPPRGIGAWPRAVAGRAWLPLLITVLLAYIGLVAHHRGVETFINGEDCLWIRGKNFGWADRTVQSYLLHDLFRLRFGARLELLYGFALGLHFLTALSIWGFTVSLIRGLRSRLRATPLEARLTGAAAGLLYLLYHSTNLTYLSGVSYQLCTLFMMLGLIFALAHLRGGRPLPWVLAAAAWLAALNTHSYALGFPLLVALLELHVRRSSITSASPASLLWRYLLLAAVLGLHIGVNMPTLVFQWGKRPDPPALGLTSEPGWIYAFFATGAEFFFARLSSGNLPALVEPRVLPTPLPGALGTLAPWLLLAALLASLIVTARQLVQRRAVGLAGGVSFLLVAWNLAVYPQIRLAPFVTEPSWRYELTVGGFCVLLALAGLWLTGRLARLIGGGPRGLAGWLLLAPLAAGALLTSIPDQRYLARVVRGEAALVNKSSCQLSRWCAAGGAGALTRAEVRRRARSRGSLACVDLRGVDLRGIDLRGADLSGANLSGADLRGVRLVGARLRGACLSWSDLAGADMGGADLREARLTGATLKKTVLCGADMQGLQDACATELVSEILERRCP